MGRRVRVCATTGRRLPGEAGQVEIDGTTVIARYEAPGYEDRFSDDGWLRQANSATSMMTVTSPDRSTDDVINRGGEKIFPARSKSCWSCPEVARAAVIGVPDEVFGQVPVAFVQLHGVDESSDRERVAPRSRQFARRCPPASRDTPSARSTSWRRLPTHVDGKI